MAGPSPRRAETDAARGKAPAVAVCLAWLVPGLGHAYLGHRRRAALYAGIVALLFVVGILLDGALSAPRSGSYLSTLATIADLGAGLFYLGAKALGLGAGAVDSVTHEAGNAYHWTAGILNLLLLFDVHDIATGRK